MATTTTETTATTEHAAKPGMPQLDTATWPSQLFWLAVTFIALYMVISRIAIPRVGGAIAKRQSTIDGDLAAAQKLKAEAQAAVEAYEQALAAARDRANALALESRNRMGEEAAAERAKLDQALTARVQEAETRIAASRSKALADVQSMAADIARDIASELTGVSISKSAADSAVALVAK
jgi:F-type H+-transporting ATPase subunit b